MSIRRKLKRLRWQLASPKYRNAWLATLHRAMLPHVTYVGVTGSCAKTTTTRLIGTVLEQAGRCRTKDVNGIVPLSLNLLSVGVLTRFCVQEISGDHSGKIRFQTRILRPQIGVVTNVGSDHYANFRSLEATARENAGLCMTCPGAGSPSSMPTTRMFGACESARVRAWCHSACRRAPMSGQPTYRAIGQTAYL
jgi:UDP-N-acetylmuramate-alanine ligase